MYQDKACSAENCSEGMIEAFTIRVTDEESFHFASQCCLGQECNDSNDTIGGFWPCAIPPQSSQLPLLPSPLVVLTFRWTS